MKIKDDSDLPHGQTLGAAGGLLGAVALGLVGQLLDQMVPGVKPRQPEKPKVDSGYRPIGLNERPLDWLVF